MAQTFDIYVGSLPSGFNKAQVEDLFERFGSIKIVKVLDNGIGPSSTIAFVHYGAEEQALQAIEEMNAYMIHGIPLKVRKSDKWLKRIGEYTNAPHKKQSLKAVQPMKSAGKLVTKQSNVNYGIWQPPSIEPQYQSKGDVINLASLVKNMPLLGSYSQNTLGRVIQESVAVTHVEDPVTFFAYFTYRSIDLQDLIAELQNVASQMNAISTAPCSSQVYGSVYSADGNLYRCKILNTDNHLNRSEIQYIDFGNKETVNNNQLVELTENLQRKIPLAIKFVYQNLQPIRNHHDNYEEALNYMKESLIDQMVSLEIMKSPNGDHMEVLKIFKNGTDIIDCMISKGYLVHTLDNTCSRIIAMNNDGSSASSKELPVASITNGRQGRGSEIKAVSPIYSNYQSHENKLLQLENQKLKSELEKTIGRNKALQDEFRRQQKTNTFTELPQILSEISQIRLLRQQLPVRPESLDYIEMAVQLLKTEETTMTPFDKALRLKTQEQVDMYNNAQENIVHCCDKELLNSLIIERDEIRKNLHRELTFFCKSIHSNTLTDKVKAFETALSQLKSVYEPFLKIETYSCEADITLEELYRFYCSTKEGKLQEFLKVQIETDLAHKTFFEEIRYSSLPLAQDNMKSISVPKILHFLENLKCCLAKEIKTCTLEDTQEASIIGVITKLLCQKLELELEGVRDLDGLEQQYSCLLQKMALGLEGPAPDMKDLMANRKDSKKLRSKLRHALADKKDLEEECEDATEEEVSEVNKKLTELRFGLHETFLEEDRLIANAASLQESVYPELNILFPDLGLESYSNHRGLVKVGLELDHFDLESIPSIFVHEINYASKFLNKPIKLKEYHLADDNGKELFLQRIQQYSEISNQSLLPVEVVFFTEKGRSVYVQQPLLQSLQSYLDEFKAIPLNDICAILRDLLGALDILHSKGIAHGRLHPETLFLTEDLHVVLDSVNFVPNQSQTILPPVNGLRFQLPSSNGKNGTIYEDVYSICCLMLWIAHAAQMLVAVRSVLEKPISQYPSVKDLLLHPSLNQRIPSPITFESCDANYENSLDMPPSLVPIQDYCSDPEDEPTNGEVEEICRSADESGADGHENSTDDEENSANDQEAGAEEQPYDLKNAIESVLSAWKEESSDKVSEKSYDQSVLSNNSEGTLYEDNETQEENNLTFESIRKSQCALTSLNTTDEVE